MAIANVKNLADSDTYFDLDSFCEFLLSVINC